MKKFKVGLQLFSIRDEMEKDMDGTLGAIKAMGYDYVEFAGFYGKSAEEIRMLLDKHGLKCISVHQNISESMEDMQAHADYLKVIGAKYSAIPWYDLEQFESNFDGVAELFMKVGKLFKDNGIQMLYHNHDFEFIKIDGEYILDKLYATVPAESLNPQLDTCWVRYAGVDPAEYIKKYTGRLSVIHLKDFKCNKLANGPVYELIGDDSKNEMPSREDNDFKFLPLGMGLQDFPAILAAAESAGVEYVIAELDDATEHSPMESAQMSREYLKTLGL